MKKLFPILVLVFFIRHETTLAQNRTIDSLKVLLSKSAEDTNKVNLLMQLALSGLPADVSLEYANKALEIEKRFDYTQRIAYLYRKMGNIYFERFSNYEKGLEYYFRSLKLYQDINNRYGIANCFNNIGNIYVSKADLSRNESDYATALQYHLKALNLREELGEKKSVGHSCLNIGNLYLIKHDYTKAIEYFNKSLDIYKTLDRNGIYLSYMSLAEAYLGMGNNKKALEYIYICKELYEQNKNWDKIADVMIILGNVYLNSNDYGKSLDYLQKGLELARKNNFKEREQKILLLLSQLYNKKKDFQDAYAYHLQYVMIKDSLLNAQISKNMGLMQTLYETEKKAKEIGSLKQEKEIQELKLEQQSLLLNRQKIQLMGLVALSLLILVSSVLFYSRYRIKQKEFLNAELLKQQELRSIAVLETEEKERSRIAQDLHDGIGQLLSAIKLNFHSLVKKIPNESKENSTLIKNISQLLDESISDTRTISHSLVPSMFGQSKLDEALTEFVNKINMAGKLRINLEIIDLPENLSNSLATSLYRVIQEAINNTIKHAQATLVSIQLIRHDKSLNLMIEDNGVGFDNSKISQNSGIGFKNIHSRIAYWKGKVQVDSHPGRGTTINIEVPFT